MCLHVVVGGRGFATEEGAGSGETGEEDVYLTGVMRTVERKGEEPRDGSGALPSCAASSPLSDLPREVITTLPAPRGCAWSRARDQQTQAALLTFLLAVRSVLGMRWVFIGRRQQRSQVVRTQDVDRRLSVCICLTSRA